MYLLYGCYDHEGRVVPHTIGCIRMMNTSDYVLLYIVVITIVYCSVGVMMKMYGV